MNPCACGCGIAIGKKFKRGHGRRRPILVRLLEKVERLRNGCWQWTGAASPNGYGRIGIGSVVLQAHRVAYEEFIGPIPADLHIDHLCRNRLCVNPDHLEAVTQAENNRRAAAANRMTECRRGHSLTETNTYLSTKGFRQCRQCMRARSRATRHGTSIAAELALLTGERP